MKIVGGNQKLFKEIKYAIKESATGGILLVVLGNHSIDGFLSGCAFGFLLR